MTVVEREGTNGRAEVEALPPAPHRVPAAPESRLLQVAVAFVVGAAVIVAATIFAVWQSQNGAESAAATRQAAEQPGAASGTHAHASAGFGFTSYAGAHPANADEIAAGHTPFPAQLPALVPGPVVPVHLTLKDVTVSIAPGVKYSAWGFEGGAPGPVIHVRQGQTVNITLTNGGAIPHSIDFHAARIAPNRAFRDVDPGKSLTYSFKASDPGVFMYHCGTKPVLAHIANGMYGAIVVDPGRLLPRADREYVLVSSEWYLNAPGTAKPAQLDLTKAHLMAPDWVTWNGYAGQYATHPLPADPGDVVRFYVVAAGPSLDTDFHVVGTILDRAWVNQDMTRYERGVQTVGVPAGGGAIFDVKIDQPGLYPFLSHSFASVDMGQVGLLNVGDVVAKASSH